jgi:predicted DNA-binding WGR domain protein
MRIYLQTPPTGDKPPRYYHLILQPDLLEGWSLVKEWGFQGSPGRLIRQYHRTREEAEQALLAARDIQLKRGYRQVFAVGQSATEEE